MQYVSTRGDAPVLSFGDVLLSGLAPDGGLYVPETWPTLSPETWGAPRPYADVEATFAALGALEAVVRIGSVVRVLGDDL
jgi:threonine synthase